MKNENEEGTPVDFTPIPIHKIHMFFRLPRFCFIIIFEKREAEAFIIVCQCGALLYSKVFVFVYLTLLLYKSILLDFFLFFLSLFRCLILM